MSLVIWAVIIVVAVVVIRRRKKAGRPFPTLKKAAKNESESKDGE